MSALFLVLLGAFLPLAALGGLLYWMYRDNRLQHFINRWANPRLYNAEQNFRNFTAEGRSTAANIDRIMGRETALKDAVRVLGAETMLTYLDDSIQVAQTLQAKGAAMEAMCRSLTDELQSDHYAVRSQVPTFNSQTTKAHHTGTEEVIEVEPLEDEEEPRVNVRPHTRKWPEKAEDIFDPDTEYAYATSGGEFQYMTGAQINRIIRDKRKAGQDWERDEDFFVVSAEFFASRS